MCLVKFPTVSPPLALPCTKINPRERGTQQVGLEKLLQLSNICGVSFQVNESTDSSLPACTSLNDFFSQAGDGTEEFHHCWQTGSKFGSRPDFRVD